MKDGVIICRDYSEAILALDDEQAGELFKAVMRYAFDGIKPTIKDQTAAVLFLLLRGQIDRMNDRYEEKCRKMAENGKKGGRPSKADAEKKSANIAEGLIAPKNKAEGLYEKQLVFDESKKSLPEPEPEPDPYPVCANAHNSAGARAREESPEQESAADQDPTFEDLWREYPKQQGYKAAREAFERDLQRGTTPEQIRSGVLAYVEYCRATNIEPRYIMQGGKFFQEQRWRDDWTPAVTKNEKPARRVDYDAVCREIYVQNLNDAALRRAAAI